MAGNNKLFVTHVCNTKLHAVGFWSKAIIKYYYTYLAEMFGEITGFKTNEGVTV